jgi:hypothetical protein
MFKENDCGNSNSSGISVFWGKVIYIYSSGFGVGGVKKGEGPGTGVNPYESGWVHKLSHVFAVYFIIVLCLNF